ncbi:hypothetical protein [Acinetobacter phage HFM1]|nr:hypothetical protein [Acinetobacter phage HFM1]
MDNEAIRDLIRVGKVTEVIGHRVRVTFEDRDNMVSSPLPVLQRFTGKNKKIEMPSMDDKVLCLFLPTGMEAGFVVGCFYDEENQPPAENNKTVYEDGSSISFKDGVLDIVMLAAVNLTTPLFTVNGDELINGNLATTGTSQSEGDISTSGTVTADNDVVGGGKSLKGHTNGGYPVD